MRNEIIARARNGNQGAIFRVRLENRRRPFLGRGTLPSKRTRDFRRGCRTVIRVLPRVLKTCPEMTYAQSTAPHCIAQLHSSFARARLTALFYSTSIFMYSSTHVHKNPAATYVRNVLYIRQTT